MKANPTNKVYFIDCAGILWAMEYVNGETKHTQLSLPTNQEIPFKQPEKPQDSIKP